MTRLLSDGCSVAVNPGGLHEQVMTDHTQEQVFMQKRLGFIRIAMAAGKPIVPCCEPPRSSHPLQTILLLPEAAA